MRTRSRYRVKKGPPSSPYPSPSSPPPPSPTSLSPISLLPLLSPLLLSLPPFLLTLLLLRSLPPTFYSQKVEKMEYARSLYLYVIQETSWRTAKGKGEIKREL